MPPRPVDNRRDELDQVIIHIHPSHSVTHLYPYPLSLEMLREGRIKWDVASWFDRYYVAGNESVMGELNFRSVT